MWAAPGEVMCADGPKGVYSPNVSHSLGQYSLALGTALCRLAGYLAAGKLNVPARPLVRELQMVVSLLFVLRVCCFSKASPG